jgi:drug/metabolite transporter (DMT)-like permease
VPDAAKPPRTAAVAAAFAVVYVVWGSTYLAIRFGVETIPPFLMAGTRHLTAGLLLYGWLRMRGGAKPEWRHWKSAAVIGGLLLLGGNGLVTWAEQRVPSGLAALIVSSVPIWMAVFEGIEKKTRPSGLVIFDF